MATATVPALSSAEREAQAHAAKQRELALQDEFGKDGNTIAAAIDRAIVAGDAAEALKLQKRARELPELIRRATAEFAAAWAAFVDARNMGLYAERVRVLAQRRHAQGCQWAQVLNALHALGGAGAA